MLDFFHWYDNTKDDIPWLVLGKGPSFSKLNSFDVSGFHVMSLNHVVDALKVSAAHVLDLDVAIQCADSIANNANVLIMPWIPHVNNRPGKFTLQELIKNYKFLSDLNEQGRLVYYNHVPSRRYGDSPLLDVRFFSSEGAIGLLAKAGVKKIRTLGIDGGDEYAGDFTHLASTTLLSNGRQTFNKQFSQFAKIIMNTNVDFSPLDIQTPIKVYVATTEAQMLSVNVLEYSIKKHASMSVEVIPMHLSDIEMPLPKDEKNWPRTPFSFQRFLIPQLQQYKGRAIYLDSDMQLFKDIKILWTSAFDGADILTVKNFNESDRLPQFSVMLLNCERLNWNIKSIIEQLNNGDLNYEKLMYQMAIAKKPVAALHNSWNSLERYVEGETALLHYTDMNSQPWVSRNNPLGYLWCRDLLEAVGKNIISKEYVEAQIAAGYVRPSLRYQLEHSLDDPLLLPSHAKALDDGFKAPYVAIHYARPNKLSSTQKYVRSLVRYGMNKAGLMKIKVKFKNYLDRN